MFKPIHLQLLIPTHVLIDQPVKKVIAEAENGYFCLLPNHIDILTALVPGILIAQRLDDEEIYLAVDGGILIKCSQNVLISTRNAVQGSHLDTLRQDVHQQFYTIDEQERETRTAIAKMEASMARQFTALFMEEP